MSWQIYQNLTETRIITRINNASMDYPICCCYFPWHNSEIFENCNIGIFRFSDPNISVFFVQKNNRSGDANQKFFRWPPNANAKFKKNLSYAILPYSWKAFVAGLFYDIVFYTRCFLTVPHFIKLFFFF